MQRHTPSAQNRSTANTNAQNCQMTKTQDMICTDISHMKKSLRYLNNSVKLSVALQFRVNNPSINPISITCDMHLDTAAHVKFCQSTVQFSMSELSSQPHCLHS